MTLSASRMFPLLLLLVLVLLTFWLERMTREEAALPAQRSDNPDFVVEGFSITDFNLAGTAESQLSAAKMSHYPNDDSTEMLSPRVVQTSPAKPRLTLTADRGTLSQDGEEVFLYDNVLVVRDALANTPASRMQTSFLHVLSARSLVRTDREISITEGSRSIVGRGMDYNNETRQLSLHAQVRGSFEVKQ